MQGKKVENERSHSPTEIPENMIIHVDQCTAVRSVTVPK